MRLWSDVRPDWPETALALYGPEPDTPAAGQLAEAIFGEPLGLRTDYSAMDDFDLLAQSVSREAAALAFMGFSGLMRQADGMRTLPVDSSQGPVQPAVASILDGGYPVARVQLLYVAASSAALPEVQGLVLDILGRYAAAGGPERLRAAAGRGLSGARSAS